MIIVQEQSLFRVASTATAGRYARRREDTTVAVGRYATIAAGRCAPAVAGKYAQRTKRVSWWKYKQNYHGHDKWRAVGYASRFACRLELKQNL